MMFAELVLVICGIFFYLATYEDIRKREVYDYLNYLFFIIIILVSIIQSLLVSDFNPLISTALGAVLGFGFGLLLYLAGIWGGGDAKFLIGFGAAVPYVLEFTTPLSESLSQMLPYMFSLLPTSVFSGFALILDGLSIVLAVLVFWYGLLLCVIDPRERRYLFWLLLTALISIAALHVWVPEYTILLSLVVMLLLLFLPEEASASAYLTRKKRLGELQAGDVLVNEVRLDDGRVLLPWEKVRQGIGRQDITLLKDTFPEESVFSQRIVLPVFGIYILTFLALILKSLIIGTGLFSTVSYLLVYLFVTFLIGGMFAVIVVVVTSLRHRRKLTLSWGTREWVVECLILGFSLLVLFVDFHLFLLSLVLLVAYPFIYLAKAAEQYLFVEKKPIEKIVPGDWIVEDVVDKKGETIYYQDEFTRGVSDYQLSRIRELARKEHIKSLWVKDGIPFLVPMILGFIVLLIL